MNNEYAEKNQRRPVTQDQVEDDTIQVKEQV